MSFDPPCKLNYFGSPYVFTKGCGAISYFHEFFTERICNGRTVITCVDLAIHSG